jgi:nitric oxide reductase NorD protein
VTAVTALAVSNAGPGLPRVDCGFAEVAQMQDACLLQAQATLSADGMQAYVEAARRIGGMGRGAGPPRAFLLAWPLLATRVGEAALVAVAAAVQALNKSPNGRAIEPFLQSLPAVARYLPDALQLQAYLDLCLHTMQRSSGSIHGVHKTYASAALPGLLAQAPLLLGQLTLQGLQHWVDYGLRNYGHHPELQRAFFMLQSADSRAVVQGQRQGTLLTQHARKLDLYLLALWQDAEVLVPYPSGPDADAQAQPYYDHQGMRLPDGYGARAGISGLDRYRAALAHMAAHRRWTTPLYADNLSPSQRLAVELLEDARVDCLAMRLYPGLRRIFAALQPRPLEGACDTATQSGLRHRLALLSRALLEPAHGYADPQLNHFAQRFQALLEQGEASTASMASLAIAYIAKTRVPSDQLPTTCFTDTVVDYRDDNRHLWKYHETSDDEDSFAPPPADPRQQTPEAGLPPRLYPEWDYVSQSYRPDWVSLYERAHPAGDARRIDQMLSKHSALAKRLKRQLELLKPQDRTRLRYQEAGSELDLDIACRALIELRCGLQPDTRINQSSQTCGRSIAVLVLLDLSASLNDRVAGLSQSILELSQEAVALLAWSIDQLGDPFAIAGFHSDTREDVRYLHLKGFEERWGDAVQARLAAMQAGYSTRMGAALRHAAHYLGAQTADKKLLLVLTDGQPADIDSPDPRLLIEDARQAVHELEQQNIFSYCINLDAKADAYVADIFGHQYTVVDRIERLPEQLPRLFMALTR